MSLSARASLKEEENQRKDKVQGFTWRAQKEERDKDLRRRESTEAHDL